MSRSANARGLNRGKTGSGAGESLERSDSAILHNQQLIAQPAGLGGIVRHYYYGRFSRGFHAKDDFFNDIRVFWSRLAVGSSRQKTSGSMTRARAMPTPGLAVLFQPEEPFSPEPVGVHSVPAAGWGPGAAARVRFCLTLCCFYRKIIIAYYKNGGFRFGQHLGGGGAPRLGSSNAPVDSEN